MPERFTDEQLGAALEALSDPGRFQRDRAPRGRRRASAPTGPGGRAGRGRLVRLAHTSSGSQAGGARGPGGAADALPHAAGGGGPDGNAGRGGGRVGARPASCTPRRATNSLRPPLPNHRGFQWTSGISATPPSSSPTATARVLVDPFLAPNNPKAPVSADEVDPTHILLTHAHVDHLADAVAVAKRTGAHCVASGGDSRLVGLPRESRTSPTRTSAARSTFDWGWVKLVQAFHSSTTPDGTVTYASGLVINIGGHHRVPPRRHVPVR